jgi:hypothetical protein
MADLEDDVDPGAYDNEGYVTIVVLNDGQTYTDVHGCELMVVTNKEYYDVSIGGGDASDFNPVVRIVLSNIIKP